MVNTVKLKDYKNRNNGHAVIGKLQCVKNV